MRIAIIGAGLAGCAAAYVLKQAGAEPVIYEQSPDIAPGASGNVMGLYNPRLSAEPGFYTQAFPLALETFSGLEDIGWNKCGALHLMIDEKRRTRYMQAVKNWNWPSEGFRVVYAQEASEIAGVDVGYDALYQSDSGIVSPKKLCMAYTKGIEIHFNQKIDAVKADIIIWAAGLHVPGFPLKPARGQITFVKETEISKKLKTNLCYGGYMTPAQGSHHMVGSTFQRWLSHSDILKEDDTYNLNKVGEIIPALKQDFKITGHRAGVRATSPDHFPIIGRVQDNIYVTAGHGSHGMVSSLGAAFILTAMITGERQRFSESSLRRVEPGRFKQADDNFKRVC